MHSYNFEQLRDFSYTSSGSGLLPSVLRNDGNSSIEHQAQLYGTDVIVLDEVRKSPWLVKVARRLLQSIDDKVSEEYCDGSTITSSIALAAIDFFKVFGPELPVEPYIYASSEGNLVAEFHSSRPLLTVLISQYRFTARRVDLSESFSDILSKDYQRQRIIRANFKRYLEV